VDPSQGDERTVFLFSVRYVDADGNAPTVSLILDDTPTTMAYVGGDNSTGAIFRLSTLLAAGDHAYKFRADDLQGSPNSTVETAESTITVAASAGVPVALVAGAGIGGAVVLAAVAYFMWRSRRPKEPEKVEAPEPKAEEPEGPKKEGE
jgi:hypothetical protein